MKRMVKTWVLAVAAIAAIACAFAPRAAAQGDGSIAGQVIDVAGKPWANIGMQAVSEQGVKQETKTDKDGNYAFRSLRSGVYTVMVILPAPNPPFEIKCRVQGGQETKVSPNFKEIVGKQGAEAAEQVKKQEEEKQKFEGMKGHFSAGTALLEQEKAAKAELQKAAPDQRDAAKQKLTELSNQASAEFSAAQKAAPEKDTNQHLLWAKLGESYDVAGRNDEAAQAYQQAVTAAEAIPSLKGPQLAGYYNNLGNVLARAGKVDEAKVAYTKSAEVDPANAATAWRNFGISLYNANRLADAIEPLQKATEIDPKNAQAWYLLGASLLMKMTTKRVGDKDQVQLAPGTIEAYQKAVDLDPSGPWGAQAKQGLTDLQAMGAGIDVKVNMKKKKS
ncbi:MAG TPA: tetratricopeptide repeat protein [Candidatus Dormibacteraeota bacterium]|nr:tetratricopeptide repeat protein [Candidatus Dormibacteraeota bacterium]